MPKPPQRRRDPARSRPSAHSPQAPHRYEPVELRWVLQALGGIVALSLVCGYITLCVVYTRTQWQLVLHPSRTVATTPAAAGLPFTEVRFAVDASGEPQLNGWWLPANAPPSNTIVLTALLLHSGDGSMADALPQAQALHNAGLNVLLFDYRGYGHSGGAHPTQATMQADADSALAYLTVTRGLPLQNILAFGSGIGGSLAVRLCAAHPQIAALILDAPSGDFKSRAEARSDLVPARWLFNQDFPLADPLHALSTPKLLISPQAAEPPLDLARAADPKMTVELPANDPAAFQQTLRRFLDTYVPANPNP